VSKTTRAAAARPLILIVNDIVDNRQIDDAEIFVAHRDPLAVGAVLSDTVRAGEHDPGAF
jgi:hypothetical protein